MWEDLIGISCNFWKIIWEGDLSCILGFKWMYINELFEVIYGLSMVDVLVWFLWVDIRF